MTNSPSSDRDELVAAYLDGEATPAERAIVEGDVELMERVAILSQVVSLVSEPVAPPPADVRRAHIAAALDASATAPNVTSMAAKRKRRFSTSQIAAAAAAVVALFAVPIALSQSGSDDDDQFTAVAAGDDGAAASDSASAAGDSVLTEGAEEPAEEAAVEEAELFADDDGAAGDDGGEALDDEAAEAPAAEEEPMDEALESDDDAGADFPLLPRFDVELAPDVDSLVTQILPPPDGARLSAPDFEPSDELVCVETITETAGGDLVVVTGSSVLDNEIVEYVVVERIVGGQPVLELTIFDQLCTPIASDTIGG